MGFNLQEMPRRIAEIIAELEAPTPVTDGV